MAFSLRLERFVGGLGIVSLGVGIMFAGFALCVLAALAGIGQFTVVSTIFRTFDQATASVCTTCG